MINSDFLKVNEPNVVHETIDGEAILLNLNSGNYFSLDGTGAVIWDYIALTGNWRRAIALLTNNGGAKNDLISTSIEKFIADLIEENLLVATNSKEVYAEDDLKEIENALQKGVANFKEPTVNKYSDMQDLLLLDPIHDVDEKGWPEAPNPPDENPLV